MYVHTPHTHMHPHTRAHKHTPTHAYIHMCMLWKRREVLGGIGERGGQGWENKEVYICT